MEKYKVYQYSDLRLFCLIIECISLLVALYGGLTGFFQEPLANYLLIGSSLSKFIKTSEPIREVLPISFKVLKDYFYEKANIKWCL